MLKTEKAPNGNLSDKDIQLIKKTYTKSTQLYYENTKNTEVVNDLINFSRIIRQIIWAKKQSDTLSLISIMEILKVKSKALPSLISQADATIEHLKKPSPKAIQYPTFIYCLQRSQLFVAGCTIGIRFYQKINSHSSDFDWKQIISELSRNISISPTLCIELVYEICRQNELYSKLAVKSGLIKFIFLSYIGSTLDNKYNLYKAIKLLKVITNAERSLLKDKQKSLALVIYNYESYIPVIQQICSKCYDQEYGQSIDNKRKYDQNSIDQPYLWSYTESFCTKNLSGQTITELIKNLQTPLNQQRETKINAVLANYCKFKKVILKEAIQILPKNMRSLLNYIKLCINNCEIDPNSSNFINIEGLQELVDKSFNPKVGQLFKYLKELKNKENKIGVLSDNIKKMFDMEKNADFMMERASKIPQNNDQLNDIKQILKQKDRTNEFQSDTLKTVKERALTSLQTAIVQKKKLDINIILKQVDLSDVKMVARLLQILQLNLTMNEELIEFVNVDRVLEIIQWIEDHYNGQLIDWGSIGQLIIILNEQGQWKRHIKEIPAKSFWILGIQSHQQNEESLIIDKLTEISSNIGKYELKIPFVIGFLGRVLSRDFKIEIVSKFRPLFELIFRNIRQNINYKTNLIMISSFIKKWCSDGQQSKNIKNNEVFKEIIENLVNLILSNFRSIEQEYEVLENALPYKINSMKLGENVQYLISLYGKLASYVYGENQAKGNKIQINYDRIKAIGRLTPQKSKNILQILSFLQDHSQILQEDELSVMLDNVMTKKYVYWLVYPNFYNILSRLLSMLSKTGNKNIQSSITNILCKVINILINNDDVSQDEKQDLWKQIQNCLIVSRNKNVHLDKDKLKRVTDKIKQQEAKCAIIQILDSLKEIQVKQQSNIQRSSEDQPRNEKVEPAVITKKQQSAVCQSTINQDQEKRDQNINIDEHMKMLDNFKGGQDIILQALRELKKIIDKQLPEQNFHKLYNIFLNNNLKQDYKDILGHLLVKFYPNRPEDIKQEARKLFNMKEKTYLSKESCYQLLSNNKETFVLSKRWKLTGRQWLDLAMLRLSQGFYSQGSQVAEYNLPKTPDIEYFASKKYHEITLSNFPKIQNIDDFSHYLVLIGTSARLVPIKQYYVKDKLHIKILQAKAKYTENIKIIGNISYALSALAYIQPEICLQIAKQRQQMALLLKSYKNYYDNKAIIQSGSCLIANLAYSNDEVKQILRQLNTSEILLSIFENIIENPQISTCKQLLRALGNLSLSPKFTQQLIDQHFCTLAVKMVQKFNIFVNFDDKKASLMKILIDLIANLASHRYKLQVFHKEKLTNMILTLLQTTQSNPAILMACIDTIDCLCQNPEIENYVVTEKKIPYLLIDVLKIQTDQKIVVKSTRLLTNLTINQTCIPYILQANLLSVLANIVMPHFYGNKLAAEQNKKMETYILKIITRISHSKQSKELILKSGYLDCLIRTIETTQNIEDSYIQILYSYSQNMPSFLNKRAFICLIRILIKKVQNKDLVNKCLRTIKNLSTIYQRDQVDVIIQGMPQMYEKLLVGEYKQDGLFLLAYHLLRSYKLRQMLQKKVDQVVQIVKKLSQDSKYIQTCREILFIIYNPYGVLQYNDSAENTEFHFNVLKKGFKCNLYRIDGSSKKAIIDINQQYQIRSYKSPDGQIKSKYVINIKNLKDFQFNFPFPEEMWNYSVFNLEKGLFDMKKVNPKTCCSLIGNIKWRQISFINIQFESEQDKVKFYRSLSFIFNSVR